MAFDSVAETDERLSTLAHGTSRRRMQEPGQIRTKTPVLSVHFFFEGDLIPPGRRSTAGSLVLGIRNLERASSIPTQPDDEAGQIMLHQRTGYETGNFGV